MFHPWLSLSPLSRLAFPNALDMARSPLMPAAANSEGLTSAKKRRFSKDLQDKRENVRSHFTGCWKIRTKSHKCKLDRQAMNLKATSFDLFWSILPFLQKSLLFSSFVSLSSIFMSHSLFWRSHSFRQGTPSLDSFSALSAMVLGDTGSSGTARREDISSVHFEPFWTLAFVLAERNELRFDSLELGPSNRCSSSSSSRTLARPALTLQEDTSSGLGTCKRCKRETGLVRHGTNMHKTNTLQLKWNTKMLWQVFKSTQWTSSKAFLMLQLSGRKLYDASRFFKSDFPSTDLITFWFLMNSWHLFDDTLQLRHMNSSASISSACLALRILLLPISNLGVCTDTRPGMGDAPGNSKKRDRSVCCLTSLSWLSILTNLEYKSLFTFTSNKIKRKQMHTAYVRHVHQHFWPARNIPGDLRQSKKNI